MVFIDTTVGEAALESYPVHLGHIRLPVQLLPVQRSRCL
jgi:hypothetical protein